MFDAIVVLCAEEPEVKGENRERIRAGINIAKKSKIPYFIFMGTKVHNQHVAKYLKSKNIQAIFPTQRIQNSTRTQIIDIANYLKKNPLANILIISHAYHIPRVKLYSEKYLQKKVDYDFWPIGRLQDQKEQLEKEMKKIKKYQSLGHL